MNTDKTSLTFARIHVLAIATLFGLVGITTQAQAKTDVPTALPPSPLFGALSFSQQMLRFEEFAVNPLPAPDVTTEKSLPVPFGCDDGSNSSAMDDFLGKPLWPAPTRLSNVTLPNPWADMISDCIFTTITGVIEGRPPGEAFSHQRWTELGPQVYFETATGGARKNTGLRDEDQSHAYAVGEFGPTISGQENETGLYNRVGGPLDPPGTTNGIEVRFHPKMPIQQSNSLWTFEDGTFPPKLLPVRYGVSTLMRHYNGLPINVSANNGFGEHTLTTHEHNGHQPGESDGYAGAYFFPGQYYDNRWPLQLAGYDSININASDPRASTPCSPGETLMFNGVEKTCDPVTGTINIRGDWHEIMSTHWFHDHMIDATAQNVYKGSVAMMNYYSGIDRGKEGFRCEYDDPDNVNLCLPSGTALDWGNRDYDIQLLIADKAWDIGGQLDFVPLNTNGFLGDRMTVNWLYDPYFDVRARQYRFRILDGSVSRFFKIAIVREFNDTSSGDFPGPTGSNKSYSRIPFHLIANDGNIMEHSVLFPNAQSNDLPIMGVAERHDIIIDFSQFPVGTKLYMVNTLTFDNGRGPKDIIPLAAILSGAFTPMIDGNDWSEDPAVGKFLEFRVQAYSGTDLSMNPADYEVGKKMMIPLVEFTDAELAAAKHRTFKFGRGGGNNSDGNPIPWTISTDGGEKRTSDLSVVSAAPETMGGGVEIWHLKNGGGGWAHPVHIHFEEGQYLSRGDTVFGVDVNRTPPQWEIGARKDIYRLSDLGRELGIPDSSMNIDVAIRFREFAGTYVEHCHNTQHEDTAMLLRWDNEHPGQTVRMPTPRPGWNGVTYDISNELATIKSGHLAAAASFVVPNQLTADLNWDGRVNLSDFSIFRSMFGKPGLWSGNINEDAVVNLRDFGLFRREFGKGNGLAPALLNPLP